MLIVLFLILLIILVILKLNSTKIKGTFGEAKVNIQVSFLGSEYISIHDLMIKNSKGNTSQIDHLVLSEYGIFVIETKNYKGWIFGNEKSENWTQVIYKEKHQFRNPIKQNWSHIYFLKELLSDFPQIKYFPIVVFAGNATLKGVQSSQPVIYENRLNKTIRNLSEEKCLTSEQVAKIEQILIDSEINEKGRLKKHIKNIKQYVIDKQEKMDNMICPRCNGELQLRNGKNGKFYGCSNYPRCKFTMSYK